MSPRLLLLALPLVVAALHAPAAGATIFCVHQGATTCPAGTADRDGDLQAALDDAAKASDADIVTIGPGTYEGPFEYLPHYPLHIAGADRDAVTLKAPAGPGDDVLNSGAASVAHLTVQMPIAASWTGIYAEGTAVLSDVAVHRPAGTSYGEVGVLLEGDAQLMNGEITTDIDRDIAVKVSGEGTHDVKESTLRGRFAVQGYPSVNGWTHVTRTRAKSQYGLAFWGTDALVDNSLVETVPGGSGALRSSCAPANDSSVAVDHVTTAGPTNGYSVTVDCDHASRKAGMAIRNSILDNERAWHLQGDAGGAAAVDVTYSLIRGSQLTDLEGASMSHMAHSFTDLDPRFAPGTFRPLGTSPAVDAGEPGPAGSLTDLRGAARLVGSAQDMGAFEFDPADPPPVPAPAEPGDTAPAGEPAPAPAPNDASPETPGGAIGASGAPAVSDADLLAELRRTLARRPRRRGTRYRHRFLVPATLTIRWTTRRHGRRVVIARRKLTHGVGDGVLKTKLRRAARRGKRVRVTGVLAPAGRAKLSVTRRARLR
ncbi:MAG TPA: choice-of-anchor Q domain-containing protein [Solirubrobacteraceae bacterium]|jgi:hypothetical protein